MNFGEAGPRPEVERAADALACCAVGRSTMIPTTCDAVTATTVIPTIATTTSVFVLLNQMLSAAWQCLRARRRRDFVCLPFRARDNRCSRRPPKFSQCGGLLF